MDPRARSRRDKLYFSNLGVLVEGAVYEFKGFWVHLQAQLVKENVLGE